MKLHIKIILIALLIGVMVVHAQEKHTSLKVQQTQMKSVRAKQMQPGQLQKKSLRMNRSRVKQMKAKEMQVQVLTKQISKRQDTIVVSRDGTGHYRTLQEAIENVRAFMDYTVTIYVKNGMYKEKVIVPSWVRNVEIIGESKENTVITYDDHANINKMGTFRTYTVKVEGNNITFRNLTIENNAAQLGQAVALHTEGDRLKFINCRFLGNQDTVYTGMERTRLYFYKCYIEGTTDFIFGLSTAFFENCTIHSKRNSYITAASTPKEIKYGYVFYKCKLTAAEGVDKVYLGRPWRPYAATVFINCELGKHILPAGWDNWRNPENERTARYAEYMNIGEGAENSQRVEWYRQLTKKEAAEYTPENIFTFSSDIWEIDKKR